MAFINISKAYTADPGNIWTPKNAFMLTDPFAIVLNVQADGSLVDKGLLFDALFQIVGPEQDTANGYPWWVIVNGDVVLSPSRDVYWNGVSFQWGTDFAIWWFWNQYNDTIAHVGNA